MSAAPPAAAGGIALICSVGNLAGCVGPYALGLLKEPSEKRVWGQAWPGCYPDLAQAFCAGGLAEPTGGRQLGPSRRVAPESERPR